MDLSQAPQCGNIRNGHSRAEKLAVGHIASGPTAIGGFARNRSLPTRSLTSFDGDPTPTWQWRAVMAAWSESMSILTMPK
jgi:hypothetical protein